MVRRTLLTGHGTAIGLLLLGNSPVPPVASQTNQYRPSTVDIRIYRGRPSTEDVHLDAKNPIDFDANLEMSQDEALNPKEPSLTTERVCDGPPCYGYGKAPKYVVDESLAKRPRYWPGIANTVEVVGPVWHQKIRWTRRDGEHLVVTEMPMEYRKGHYASRTITFEKTTLTITAQPHDEFYVPSPLCPAFGPPPPRSYVDPPQPLPPRPSVP